MVVLAKEVEAVPGAPVGKQKQPVVFLLFSHGEQVEAGESGLGAVFLIVAFLITVIKYRTKAA